MDEIISEEDIIGWNDTNSISFHTQGRVPIETPKGGGDASRPDVGFVCGQYLFNYILQEEKFVWRPDNKYMYINGEKEGDPNDTDTKINLSVACTEYNIFIIKKQIDNNMNKYIKNVLRIVNGDRINPFDGNAGNFNIDEIRNKYANMEPEDIRKSIKNDTYKQEFEKKAIFDNECTMASYILMIPRFADTLGMKNINIITSDPNFNVTECLKQQLQNDMLLGAIIQHMNRYIILIMYDGSGLEPERRKQKNENKEPKDYRYAIVDSLTSNTTHPVCPQLTFVTEEELYAITNAFVSTDTTMLLLFGYPQHTPYKSVAYKRMMAAVLDKAGNTGPTGQGFTGSTGSTCGSQAIFFEEQTNAASCGRNAINNLVQGERYNITANTSVPIDVLHPTFPMNSITLCTYLTNRLRILRPTALDPFNCQDIENYTDTFLEAAMNLLMFQLDHEYERMASAQNQPMKLNIEQFVSDEQKPENNDMYYLINLGGGHWTAARKIGNLYYYLDGIEKSQRLPPRCFSTKQQLLNYIREIHARIFSILVFRLTNNVINPFNKYLPANMKDQV